MKVLHREEFCEGRADERVNYCIVLANVGIPTYYFTYFSENCMGFRENAQQVKNYVEIRCTVVGGVSRTVYNWVKRIEIYIRIL